MTLVATVGAQDSEAATEAAERATAPLLSFAQALVKKEKLEGVTKKSLAVAWASVRLLRNFASDASFLIHAYGRVVAEQES